LELIYILVDMLKLLGQKKYLYNIICAGYLLSSREVEGNGPMKPGNPLAKSQGRCQFRRSNSAR
jgi:hypothetical protein